MQGSTKPQNIWVLPHVGTLPAGGLPPLHALKYYRCAAPSRLVAGRGKGLQPPRNLRAVEPCTRELHAPYMSSRNLLDRAGCAMLTAYDGKPCCVAEETHERSQGR